MINTNKDCDAISRAYIPKGNRQMIYNNARIFQTDSDGNMLSPNGTGKIITENTNTHIGHVPSFENKYEVEFSTKAGLTQAEHNKMFTNPGQFQIEPAEENISHEFENHDYNDGMQNVMAYACAEDKNIAARTYINPSQDGQSGYISVVNAKTGEESHVCDYGTPTTTNTTTTTIPGCESINGMEFGSNSSNAQDAYANLDTESSNSNSIDDTISDSSNIDSSNDHDNSLSM